MTQRIRYIRYLNQRDKKSASDALQAALLSEYTSLRREILARHALRNQILIFSIVGLGIAINVPSPNTFLSSTVLFYPILIAFLAVGWAQHDIRIGEFGHYIAHAIEPRVDGLSWESHLHQTRTDADSRTVLKPWVRFSEFYALGVLGGSIACHSNFNTENSFLTVQYYSDNIRHIINDYYNFCSN